MKATSWASPRAACPGCASHPSSARTHQALAVRARDHAERLLDERGRFDPARDDLAALGRELDSGWLRHLAAAEPASGS